MAEQTAREREIAQCKRTILEHREVDSKIKELRESTRDLQKQFAKTENDLKALQSVGQIIGEVLKKLDNEKYIVKASSGPTVCGWLQEENQRRNVETRCALYA